MADVFLTGGTGFLGSHVRELLKTTCGEESVAELPRSAGADLLKPASYERELAGASAVVHLAAATGRASEAEHFRVNVDGTRTLIEFSQRMGVRRFVLVSSIATTFADIRRYPYARSKLAAEEIVAGSGLDYTIVRPTIIAGRGSPVLTGLRKLVGLPVVPVFGPGNTRVQPIYVSDLAACLTSVIRDRATYRQTIELGGPDVVTIEQLLAGMRRVLTRKKDARFVHVPLVPVVAVLELLERVAYGALPVTIGQLATFRYDGVARPNPVFERHRAAMIGFERMLELSFAP
jgi:NADH dehydrogenase